MGRVDPSVIAERNAVDFIRTVVRLRDRMRQREELNELEASFLKDLHAARAKGEAFELEAAKFVKDLLDEA